MTPEDLQRFADAMRAVAERVSRALAVMTAADPDYFATLQRSAARRQGQVVCDFPHDTIIPADPERLRSAYCPLCRAAL